MNKNSFFIVLSLLLIAVSYTNCGNFESTTGNRNQSSSSETVPAQTGSEPDQGSSTPPTSEATPQNLTVTQLEITELSSNTITITWSLTKNSTGQIEYGLTKSLGKTSKKESSFRWDKHIQSLEDLTPDTKYYFRVNSEDESGNKVVSIIDMFTTAKATVVTPETPQPANWPKNANGELPLAGIFYGNYMPGVGAQNAGIGVESSRRFRAERTGLIN